MGWSGVESPTASRRGGLEDGQAVDSVRTRCTLVQSARVDHIGIVLPPEQMKVAGCRAHPPQGVLADAGLAADTASAASHARSRERSAITRVTQQA